ncbi:MAG: 30S ribosomal protein S5 [Planctomycetota bacterium]|nr:MAG: 30S ribosomal protein S5 [Planctomycetota bacterium]
MAEVLDEASHLESSTVNIYRTAATVKGGRRFSFGALVVVGDRRGKVGYGYGKSNEVPSAIEKAQKQAKRSIAEIPMAGKTIPHEVEGRFGSARVRLIPASPGTGVVAGGTVRTVLEMAGITDCLTKCYGSTNKLNVVKAVFDGIGRLKTREQVAELRGIEITTTDIEERIERGQRFMPKTTGEKMAGPVNTIGQDRRGGGRGGRGGRAGGRRQAEQASKPAPESAGESGASESGGEDSGSSES